MEKFTIWKNEYLREKTNGYYNTFYIGYKQEGNPDFLNDLKNTFGNTYRHVLLKAKNEVCNRLLQDLPKVVELENLIDPICVCVPRSRADMVNVQQYFRVAHSTLRVYLCRAEFAHIMHTSHKKKGTYYYGITNADIKKLQELATSARKRTGRLKDESK